MARVRRVGRLAVEAAVGGRDVDARRDRRRRLGAPAESLDAVRACGVAGDEDQVGAPPQGHTRGRLVCRPPPGPGPPPSGPPLGRDGSPPTGARPPRDPPWTTRRRPLEVGLGPGPPALRPTLVVVELPVTVEVNIAEVTTTPSLPRAPPHAPWRRRLPWGRPTGRRRVARAEETVAVRPVWSTVAKTPTRSRAPSARVELEARVGDRSGLRTRALCVHGPSHVVKATTEGADVHPRPRRQGPGGGFGSPWEGGWTGKGTGRTSRSQDLPTLSTRAGGNGTEERDKE